MPDLNQEIDERLRKGSKRKLTVTGNLFGATVWFSMSLEVGHSPVHPLLASLPNSDYAILLALLEIGARTLQFDFEHILGCGGEAWSSKQGNLPSFVNVAPEPELAK